MNFEKYKVGEVVHYYVDSAKSSPVVKAGKKYLWFSDDIRINKSLKILEHRWNSTTFYAAQARFFESEQELIEYERFQKIIERVMKLSEKHQVVSYYYKKLLNSLSETTLMAMIEDLEV